MNISDATFKLSAMKEEEVKYFLIYLIGRLTFSDAEFNSKHLPYNFDSAFEYFYSEFKTSEMEE